LIYIIIDLLLFECYFIIHKNPLFVTFFNIANYSAIELQNELQNAKKTQ